MKKGRFLWSAHRITERQKAGKARSIKGKQLKNSRSTVSKQHAVHHSSPSANRYQIWITIPRTLWFWGFFVLEKGSASQRNIGGWTNLRWTFLTGIMKSIKSDGAA